MEYLSKSDWTTRFLDMARLVATWSKDPSTKVGAVIVRPDRTVASVGYNGFPRGTSDHHQHLNNRDIKLRRTVHAEINAILTSRDSVVGCTIYVTPLHPCASCAGAIIQSGIKRVVAELAKDPHPGWTEDFEAATRMFREAGIAVDLITPEVTNEVKV